MVPNEQYHCDRCGIGIKLEDIYITGYIEVAPSLNRGDEELWINVMHGHSKYCSEECFIDEIKERFIKRGISKDMERSHVIKMAELTMEWNLKGVKP